MPACWPTSASMAHGVPAASAASAAIANTDIYNSVIAGKTLTVSDPAKGVIANDVNVLRRQGGQAPHRPD